MAGEPKDHEDKPSGKQKPQKANLGQKEAGEEKEKRS